MRILIIDDNPYDAELSQFSLMAIPGIEFDYVENFTKFKALFSPGKYVAIISDYALADCVGTDVLKYVKELEPEIPFIIVSGTIGEEEAVRILHLGATDYVLKNSINKLPIALLRALEETEAKKNARFTSEKLEASEKRFRALIEKSSDIITLISLDGKILYGSPALTNALGYVPKEYINRSVDNFIYPDDVSRLMEYKIALLQTSGKSFFNQLRLKHKNGSWIWFEGIITNMLQDPNVSALVSNFHDISERKKAEEELKIAHERLLFHLENTPLGFFEWDNKFQIKARSKRADEIFGWSGQELNETQKNGFNLVYEEDLAWVTKELQMLLDGKIERNKIQNRNITATGKIIWCEWFNSAFIDENGKVVTVISLVQDITEQKELEKLIIESEAKFRSFFENSIDGILLTVTDGQILAANPAACEIFGMTEEEIIKAGRLGLVDMTDSRINSLIEERQRKGNAKGEVTLVRKDGSKFEAELSSAMFKDAYGNERTSIIIRDITERKQAQLALQISHALLLKNEEKLKEAQVLAQVGSWEIDLQTNKTFWSEELNNILGIVKIESEPSTELFSSFIHPDDADYAKKNIKESYESLHPSTLDFRFIRKDGKVRYAHVERRFEFDKNNKPVRYHGILQDITERKAAEQKLQEANALLLKNEERLKEAQEIALTGNWEIDMPNQKHTWSDQFYKKFELIEKT